MKRLSVTVALLLAVSAAGAARADAAALPTPAAEAGKAFLQAYLQPDGRVVRTDQGGDTVSGGQAQAMLVEVALGDEAGFKSVWTWTEANLQLPNALLASTWSEGHVTDKQPASDADLDAARALVLAAKRFHVSAYRRSGLRIARSVLAQETVVRGGMRVLVAGPWATGSGIVAPGYWSPRTFELLRVATGDRRFAQLGQSSIALARQLLTPPQRLPAEWASISAKGKIAAIGPPPPHPAAPIEYSLVGARLPIRFEESCSRSARAVAASVWPVFAGVAPSTIGLAYSPTGAVLDPNPAAITVLAAAAAAQAAGKTEAREALLAQAQAVNAATPTYYGSAWLALTEIQMSSKTLGAC